MTWHDSRVVGPLPFFLHHCLPPRLPSPLTLPFSPAVIFKAEQAYLSLSMRGFLPFMLVKIVWTHVRAPLCPSDIPTLVFLPVRIT